MAASAPFILRVLPEPGQPCSGERYRELAETRYLGASSALVAALSLIAIASGAENKSPLGAWMVFCSAGVLLAFIDYRRQLLPIWIVVPSTIAIVALLALAAVIDAEPSHFVRAMLCGLGVWGFLWLSWFLSNQALGYGDVRLGFALGALLGYLSIEAVFLGIWLACLLGSVQALRPRALAESLKRTIAFGPALISGTLISLVIFVR